MKLNNFEFSDLISGYVTNFSGKNSFTMKTSDGKNYTVHLGSNLFGRMLRNLNEPYSDCTNQIRMILKEGQMALVYGIYYPTGITGDDYLFEAKSIDFVGKDSDTFRFEEGNWWIQQARSIADFFVNAQFSGQIDYLKYLTRSLYQDIIRIASDRKPIRFQDWCMGCHPPICLQEKISF